MVSASVRVVVSVMPADASLQTPLAIQSLGRTVGVALLVTAEGSTAGGFALSCSLTTPLGTGMTLVQDPD